MLYEKSYYSCKTLQYPILCIVKKIFGSTLGSATFASRMIPASNNELLETRLAQGWGVRETGKHSSIRLEGPLGMGYRPC